MDFITFWLHISNSNTKCPMLLVLISESEKKEMKTKSNCASDGSVTLANSFYGVELY